MNFDNGIQFTEAKSVMSDGLVKVESTSGLASAFQLMRSHRIRHLPVVDSNGWIIGILSDRDVNRAMLPEPSADVPRGAVEFNPAHRVGDFMSWPVWAVPDHAPVGFVAQQMLEQKISAVLIRGSSGRVKGIVTTDDLLRLLVETLGEVKAHAERPVDEVMGRYGAAFAM
jgi:acetoin utilization protein AcuB